MQEIYTTNTNNELIGEAITELDFAVRNNVHYTQMDDETKALAIIEIQDKVELLMKSIEPNSYTDIWKKLNPWIIHICFTLEMSDPIQLIYNLIKSMKEINTIWVEYTATNN